MNFFLVRFVISQNNILLSSAFVGDINRMEGTARSDTMQSPTSASEAADISPLQSEGSRKLRDGQKSLHILLKPEISRICHVLPLPVFIS